MRRTTGLAILVLGGLACVPAQAQVVQTAPSTGRAGDARVTNRAVGAPGTSIPASFTNAPVSGVYVGTPITDTSLVPYPVLAPVYGSTANLPGGFTYSYYGSWTNQPRVYQSYGPADPFPFYGQPYGHAYDRYSWAAMSGENRLARYYYPPVP